MFYDAAFMTRWLMAVALTGCGYLGFDPRLSDAGNEGDTADGGEADGRSPGATGWTLVQTKAVEGLTLRVDPLGAQHLIIVAVQSANAGEIMSITDSSHCNSYTSIAMARASCALANDLQIFYAKNSCAGADTITITLTSSLISLVAWEVSSIHIDDPLDTASALNEQPATTTPLGPSITTSADGDFVVSAAIVEHFASGVHPGNAFTNDQLTHGNAWSHLTDATAKAGVYQAQWDQPELGTYCASAAAFKAVR